MVVETWIEMPGVLLRLGVCWEALLPRWPPHYQRWVPVPWSGFTAWYVCRETQTITYPTKGCTLDVQALRKASTDASNLNKDEMCFNFSQSISIQVSTTIGSQLPSTPDMKLSSFLGWTPVRWVWAEEATWHHSSMQVMGSWIGEFPDPLARRAR
jgi:hypothetical protein